MENVPWHHEVVTFGQKLCAMVESYGMASEHEHSNCILLAKRDKFFVDGRWNTWIDYDKFHSLVQRYYDSEGKKKTLSNFLNENGLIISFLSSQVKRRLPPKTTSCQLRTGLFTGTASADSTHRTLAGTGSHPRRTLAVANIVRNRSFLAGSGMYPNDLRVSQRGHLDEEEK